MNEKIIFKSNMVQNKEYASEKKTQLTKGGKIGFNQKYGVKLGC